MIDEARMIEIAQRFRKLEDAIEAADLFLASFKEDADRCVAKANADYGAGKISFQTFCNRTNEPEADLLKLAEVRADIESRTERCRDDMNEMQEEIRRLSV